jgi:hypothetical protein
LTWNKGLKYKKVGLDTSYVKKHNDDESKNIWCLVSAYRIKEMTAILARQLREEEDFGEER